MIAQCDDPSNWQVSVLMLMQGTKAFIPGARRAACNFRTALREPVSSGRAFIHVSLPSAMRFRVQPPGEALHRWSWEPSCEGFFGPLGCDSWGRAGNGQSYSIKSPEATLSQHWHCGKPLRRII